MKRILFVDDEPKILRGLQRMLCDLEDEWEMEFVESGTEALKLLEKRPIDVIVSDMRMPQMDGAQLLNTVMQEYPQVVRIVLSGHSERELILRSVGATHRFLSKPCDPGLLHQVVTEACSLRNTLTDSAVMSVVSKLTNVPSMPQLYIDIMHELESPNGSLKKAGEIISKDVGMTAKILQIVNSSFFGLPRHISDPGHAANLLGLDTLKSLILSVNIFSKFDVSMIKNPSFLRLWEHSMETGALAARIAAAETSEVQVRDHAMMAGLLHDTGKLILANDFTEKYKEVLNIAQEKGISYHEAEKEVFNTTHAEVGAYLFGLWGLPDPMVEAVAYHHQPERSVVEVFTPLTAVHVANILEQSQHSEAKISVVSALSTDYLDRLNIGDKTESWKQLCVEPV